MTTRCGLARTGAVALTVAAVLSVAGCNGIGGGSTTSGSPTSSGNVLDPTNVAGLPVTDGPSGPKSGVPDAHMQVNGTDNGSVDKLVVNSLSDIFTFWKQEMPKDFNGKQFQPITKLNSFDSRTTDENLCGEPTKGDTNAWYCDTEKSISWDRGVLLPVLIKQFGPMAVPTVLSHETGHAVQYQLGSSVTQLQPDTPTIVYEQQADCYAGSFMRWVAEGKAPHLQLSTGPGLSKELAAMVLLKDPTGAAKVTDEGSHGTAFDRVYAFQQGFENGPPRCNKINLDEVKSRATEDTFTPDEQRQKNGNVTIDQNHITELKYSLDQAFQSSDAEKLSLNANNNGKCQSSNGTPPASYCPKDKSISIDLQALQQIGAPPPADDSFGGNTGGGTGSDQNPSDGAGPPDSESPSGSSLPGGGSGGGGSGGGQYGNGGAGIGDFAAFAEIASRYELAVEQQKGLSDDGENAGLRTSCLTGVWAQAARKRMGSQRLQLLLAPGDLDKAITELLTDHSLIAADENGKSIPSGFARVESFRIGYLQGMNQCLSQFK
ncbi:MAG: neutral zinc metallopeptidase [Sciscionella sp.]|nr:neutral zinc metallopeptidase [Sciscionella sp.]